VVFVVFDDTYLAFAVFTAVLVTGASATNIGLLLPWLLSRLDINPACGSGPVEATIQDLLSLPYFCKQIVGE
jgi:magnesium transporter